MAQGEIQFKLRNCLFVFKMAVSMKNYPFVALVSISLLPVSAFADETSPLQSVYACASITTDTERLACFDAAVAAAKKSEDEGEFATITRKDAENVQKDAFGFSFPSLPKLSMPSLKTDSTDPTVKRDDEGQIAEIELAITSIYTNGYGKTVVKFENGQVWEQTDTSTVLLSKKRPPTSAVVKRAALGSYLIRLNTQQRFKAKRIE